MFFICLFSVLEMGKRQLRFVVFLIYSTSQLKTIIDISRYLVSTAGLHDDERSTEYEQKSRYTKASVPLIPEDKKPILIWWTKDLFPHDRKQNNHLITCKRGPCITSIDRGLKNDPATRAFMFYGTDLRADDLPLPRKAWDEWALFHEESPKNNWMLTHEDALR